MQAGMNIKTNKVITFVVRGLETKKLSQIMKNVKK